MKKIIETSDIVMSNNIESYYLASDKRLRKLGKIWYKEAQDFVMYLSKKYNVDPFRISGANAYLSINNRWERNKVDTEATVGAFASGKFTKEEFMKLVKVCTYNANKSKAWDVLEKGEMITAKSPKIHSFAMNVGLLSPDHITIDKWQVRASLTKAKDGRTDTQTQITSVQYRRIEAITAKLAKKYKLKGYEFQAIVWLTIKSIWEK
jgi:hypothetical protein